MSMDPTTPIDPLKREAISDGPSIGFTPKKIGSMGGRNVSLVSTWEAFDKGVQELKSHRSILQQFKNFFLKIFNRKLFDANQKVIESKLKDVHELKKTLNANIGDASRFQMLFDTRVKGEISEVKSQHKKMQKSLLNDLDFLLNGNEYDFAMTKGEVAEEKACLENKLGKEGIKLAFSMALKKGVSAQGLFDSAIEKGYANVISMLKEAGADINKADKSGKTALDKALNNDDSATVMALKEVGVSIRKEDLLYFAVKAQDIDIVKKLLNGAVDLNAKVGPLKQTLLHLSVEQGNLDLVRVFIDAGADINARQENGLTVLHTAVTQDNMHIVHALLDAGADVNKTSGESGTALHYGLDFLGKIDADVVKAFIKKGVNLNLPTGRGTILSNGVELQGQWNTVLHLAAQYKGVDIMAALLEAPGCPDINTRSHMGTPLDVVERRVNYIATHLHEQSEDFARYSEVRTFLIRKGARSSPL